MILRKVSWVYIYLFIYLFIYLLTITLLTKKNTVHYLHYLQPNTTFLHTTEKKERKTTYKGLVGYSERDTFWCLNFNIMLLFVVKYDVPFMN